MSKYYPITGIPGTPSTRLELSSWSISEDKEHQIQVSLFIRALDHLQRKNPLKEELSFYRLAGIHGIPDEPWDNAPKRGGGYCHHNSYLFPTWHRPYVLLYEQCLYNIMIKDLVPSIKDQSRRDVWNKAAEKWRLPFWDWALHQTDTNKFGVPKIVGDENVIILELGELDKQKSVSFVNPLFKFTNRLPTTDGSHVDVPMGDARMKEYAVHPGKETQFFEKSIGTSRYGNPNGSKWATGEVQNTFVASALDNPEWGRGQATGSIAHNVYRLLSDSYFKSYGPFSSTKYAKDHVHTTTEFLSLEMIHNNIHDWSGGSSNGLQGHMANVPVAAFDPIFWMHHCNVDRLLAIWQFLNKTKWFDGIPPNGPKPTDSLPPFHKDVKGTEYNLDDIQSWEKLGYNYPELRPGMTVPELNRIINEKYNKFDNISRSVPGIGDTIPDYVINVQYNRYALDGNPYTIRFTVSDASGENPRFIGQIYNFSSPLELSCGNCESQKRDGVLSKGQVPITLDLHDIIKHEPEFFSGIPGEPPPSMSPNYMGILLGQMLTWEITTPNGETIPLDTQPDLLVTVYSGKASFPSREKLDAFDPGTYTPLYKATHGKPTGARDPLR